MGYSRDEVDRFEKSLAAKRRILKAGVTPNGHRVWKSAERDVLREFYPDYQAIKRKLRRRSLAAIRAQCHLMGLTPKKTAWTGFDRSKLRRLFTTATKRELLEAFPGRTYTALQVTGYQMGLRRPRKKYVKTQHPVVDDLREACRTGGFYMPHMDEFAGTKKYFTGRIQRRKKHNFRAIDRAVKALGGKLVVVWDEDVDG